MKRKIRCYPDIWNCYSDIDSKHSDVFFSLFFLVCITDIHRPPCSDIQADTVGGVSFSFSFNVLARLQRAEESGCRQSGFCGEEFCIISAAQYVMSDGAVPTPSLAAVDTKGWH